MKSCLVTGCNGFVGSYLTEFLIKRGVTACGIVHHDRRRIVHLQDRINIFECDLLDGERVRAIATRVKPDLIFHLAAQSRASASWKDAENTLKVNVLGTLHLLEGVRKAAIDPVVVVVCSAAEYGNCDRTPIKEEDAFNPSSPYAVSKVAQDLLVHLYWQRYGMRVIRVRPFNITGPGIIDDACSDFARGIVAIEKGRRNVFTVGNLDSVRDITDVRDAVEAFCVIAYKGTPGEVYNLCSGVGYRIGDLLDKLVNMAIKKVSVFQDSTKVRAQDDQLQIGDNSKLCSLDWKPVIPIEKTLSDMLDYWRKTYERDQCRRHSN